MNKNEDCKHDFLAVLHCKKCGEQFHVNWLEAVKQAKLDAVVEVLERTKSTIIMKAKGETKERATEIALAALEEVREIYEDATSTDQRVATDIALELIEKSKADYKGTIS